MDFEEVETTEQLAEIIRKADGHSVYMSTSIEYVPPTHGWTSRLFKIDPLISVKVGRRAYKLRIDHYTNESPEEEMQELIARRHGLELAVGMAEKEVEKNGGFVRVNGLPLAQAKSLLTTYMIILNKLEAKVGVR